MAAMYSVIVKGEDEARRRLAEMCEALDLEPMYGGRVLQSVGTGKHQVCAKSREPRPDDEA